MSGTLREVIDNGTTTMDKPPLNGLGVKKGEPGGVSMTLKTGMEVAQYYIFLKIYKVPRHNNSGGARGYSGTNFFLPGDSKEKFGREPPPDAFIMNSLEILLTTKANKACWNASGSIVERFIKTLASITF